MKLTKEQAVHEHRMMWRWLAEFYAAIDRWNGKVPTINCAKKRYLSIKKYKEIGGNCFCCEYVSRSAITCRECPIVWHNKCHCTDGEFGIVNELSEAKEISDMCRIIAELPER